MGDCPWICEFMLEELAALYAIYLLQFFYNGINNSNPSYCIDFFISSSETLNFILLGRFFFSWGFCLILLGGLLLTG